MMDRKERSRLPSDYRNFVCKLPVLGLLIALFFLSVGLKAQEISPEILKLITSGRAKAVIESLKQVQKIPEEIVPPESVYFYTPPPTKPSDIELAYRMDTSLVHVSRELTQFGYSIFSDTLLPKLKPWKTAEPVKVGPDYILGPGDKLVVNAWGKIDQSFEYTIDRDGKIVLPKTGPLFLWGKTLGDAEKLITDRMKQAFSGVNFYVTLGKLRTVPVFVVGEVNLPGVYQVQSVVTPLHLLVLALGVKKSGSLRNLKVIKPSGDEEIIDLYDLFVFGKKPKTLYLSAGDILYVPPIGEVAAVTGSVKRPAIYEILHEKTLYDLIKLAGGFSFNTYIHRIQIERTIKNEHRIVEDILFDSYDSFKKQSKKIKIQDGDLVIVLPILPQRKGYVTVVGNVFRPGDYSLDDAKTVKDLIEAASGLKPSTYMERADLIRINTVGLRKIIAVNLKNALAGNNNANLQLNEWDTLRIYTVNEAVVYDSINVLGAVYKPGKIPYFSNMKLTDALFQAGGLRAYAFKDSIEIYRIVDDQIKTLTVNLNGVSGKDFRLQPGDWIFIKKDRKKVPEMWVNIYGEVRYPGSYPIRAGETIGSLIQRAGGLTANAYPKAVSFFRRSTKDLLGEATRKYIEQAYIDLLIAQEKVNLSNLPAEEKAYKSEIINRHKDFLVYITRTPDTTIFDTVQMSVLYPEMEKERVVIDLTDTLSLSIPLEEGDSLFIPREPQTIQVIGAVRNPLAIVYDENLGVNDYIDMAGGYRDDANKKGIYIVKASGVATRNMKKLEPGDTIVVPEKIEPRTPPRIIFRDVATILYQAVLAFLTIYTLTR